MTIRKRLIPSTPRWYEMRQPHPVLDELDVGDRRVEAPPEQQRRREGDERHGERHGAHRPLALGTIAASAGEHHQQGADQRQEHYR
jgi:hypothetical protein